ncbi:amidoligase family protein [Zhongshania sp.]|uniref:amidoligase family protein n=1 Tax=Zhongshania sp. TaxID=1971902 RepID=UPI00356A6C52
MNEPIKFGAVVGKLPDRRAIVETPSLVLSNCYVGIELEFEDVPQPENFEDILYFWKYDVDDSLRGDYPTELILRHPLAGVDVITALEQISSAVSSGEMETPTINERTSTHVHIDVRDLSGKQLLRFLLLSFMCEEFLQNFCADYRRNNLYCIPAYNCGDLRDRASCSIPVTGDLSDDFLPHALHSVASRYRKYSGINFRTAASYGSLEFRHLEATYDKDRLLLWINLLQSLKKFAMLNEIPLERFPETISNSGPMGFIREIFGELYEPLMSATPEDVRIATLYRGLRTAQEVVYGHALDIAHHRVVSGEVLNPQWVEDFGETKTRRASQSMVASIGGVQRSYIKNFLGLEVDDVEEEPSPFMNPKATVPSSLHFDLEVPSELSYEQGE